MAGEEETDRLTSSGPIMGALGVGVRLVMLVPVVAIQLAAIALIYYGSVETWHFVEGIVFSEGDATDHDHILLLAIEIVDLFLLATVVQVVSLGLYQLYFHQDLQLPPWLKIRTLDDLKSKLVGVVITVMSVYFLGRALTWTEGEGIAYLGVAVALVIVALTYFLSKIDSH